MNEKEIEMAERFLIDKVGFFLGKPKNWSPRAQTALCGPNYSILNLAEYTLYLFKGEASRLAMPSVLKLIRDFKIPLKSSGRLSGLDYVLTDEHRFSNNEINN